jgi:two-component system sensor kinase FixL
MNMVSSLLPQWLPRAAQSGGAAPLALFAVGAAMATLICALIHARGRARFERQAREVAEATRRFQVTFDQAAVGIAHMDPEGRWLRVNDRFCEIVGFTRDDLVDHSFRDITHPDDLPRDLELMSELIAGIADHMAIDKRYVRKDGIAVWTHVTRSVVRNSDGKPEFFVSVVQDISARKEAEQCLVSGEARYRAIVDSAVETVAVVNSSGIIQSINPAVERIFGYRPEELIGLNVAILLAEASQYAGEFSLSRHVGSEHQHVIGGGREIEGLRKDGSIFPLDVSVAEWKQGEEVFFTGIMRDISARKQAEQALIGSEERLRLLQNEFAHLARVNDLGEMAAAIAHEINQPLAAIVNYLNSGLFLADSGQSEENFAFITEDMARASEQALRAGEIVKRLRAFISQGAGVRTVESVEQLVDGAMALALIDAKYAGISVEKQIEAEAVQVEVDRIQIHQVIVNLLRNAVDAMMLSPPGKPRQLRVAVAAEGEDVVAFVVADTGPGISPDIYEHLFEPFVTSKMNGMGMGLSLCQRLIESHGGTISVENRPDMGATFTFRLPRFRPELAT